MNLRSPYAHVDNPAKKGCNELIERFKQSVPIGSPMMLRTGRSGTLPGTEFGLPRIYILLEKCKHFAVCGIELPDGKWLRECFSYHEILQQHGQVTR